MKYARLIYSETTAEEYAGIVPATRQVSDTAHGPWIDCTRAGNSAVRDELLRRHSDPQQPLSGYRKIIWRNSRPGQRTPRVPLELGG